MNYNADTFEFESSSDLDSIQISLHRPKSPATNLMGVHQSRILKQRIIPEMVAQAAEDGLSISRDAPWKLYLSYIPYGGRVGFVKW